MDSSKLIGGLVELAMTWGLRIVGVLVALWVASMVSRWLGRSLAARLHARDFDATLTKFFSNLVRYAVMVGAVIGCLGVFGIQTASFAAAIAAVGLAVGLALQGTLSNFAAGVMLLIFRPFKVGDVVRVAGELGKVESVDLFTTDLKTFDNRRLILPNGEIFGKPIENITYYPIRRVDVDVGASYDADTENTRQVLEGCLPQIANVLQDPPPQIFLKQLGASSVDWQVRVWCNGDVYWDVYQDTIRVVKKALDGARVSIPFPQMDVHLDDKALAVLGSGPAA